jgi:hypothetical protein
LGQRFAQAHAAGLLNHKCEICGATDLHVELGATKFRTMAEAKGPLEELEHTQLETRAFFKGTRN